MMHLSRRRFLHTAGALATLAALPGCGVLQFRSQQPARIPRIGVLSGSDTGDTARIEPFRQGLVELGYLDGQTVALEWRFAEGRNDRLPELAAELVRVPVDVLVTLGATPTAQAAMRATDTIPIVFLGSGDPVAGGLVESMARPGRNATGTSNSLAVTSTKRVEVLKDILPDAKRFDLLINPNNPLSLLNPVSPTRPKELAELEALGQARGLSFKMHPMRGPQDFDTVFGELEADRPDGIVLYGDAVFNSHVARLADLATEHRLPALFPFRDFAVAGGLVTYGVNLTEIFKRGAYYVDRILKGTKPAELPAEQASTFELVINIKTARMLGLDIPQAALLQATEIIQ